jgi:hypothetical protein
MAGNGSTSLGDGLQIMYPGINPVGIATSLDGGAVPSSVFRGVIEFDIALNLQMLINGVWTDLGYPGMVIADAESMNATAAVTEYISATTNGTAGWQILDVRNDAASIGQDPAKYKLDIGSGGSHFKLYNDLVNDMGVQAVMYAEGTTALTDVQMRGRGVTALALGFIAPFDYGDAPASYGEAAHYIDNLALNGTPITADGTYTVTDQTIASLVTPTANVFINQLPDADGGLSHNSPNADIDGATTVPDYDGSGTYTLISPITNNTGLPSQLAAWIDWNNNGIFDASEGVLQTLPASGTSASFTWNGLTTHPDPNVIYMVRVRVTTDALTSPTGGSTDGEVEDYPLKAVVGLSGNVFHDGNGLTNNTVDGAGTNVGGVLYVNLVDGTGNIVATAPVGSDGTYEFGGALAGNYTLQLSINQGVPGSLPPAIALPAGWISTGENLSANPGNDGTVNAILPVTVTAGVVVTNANFGIEQLPVANDQSYVINVPIVGSSLALNGTGAADSPGPLSGADPEDGALGAGSTIVITDLSAMNGNELYYNGILLPTGTSIPNYDPALLSIKFAGIGSTSANFDYTFTDAAGKTGTSGTYAVSWAIPLPVTLANFTVTKERQTALLVWTTTEETNSDRFEIERSFNGKTWQILGTVNAKGESKVLLHYSFSDAGPAGGSNYYRLKMIDRSAGTPERDGRDATFAYSRVRSIYFDTETEVLLYPNPVVEKLSITVSNMTSVENIQITNLAGKVVYSSAKSGHSSHLADVDMKAFPAGLYVLSITHSDGTITAREVIKR